MFHHDGDTDTGCGKNYYTVLLYRKCLFVHLVLCFRAVLLREAFVQIFVQITLQKSFSYGICVFVMSNGQYDITNETIFYSQQLCCDFASL